MRRTHLLCIAFAASGIISGCRTGQNADTPVSGPQLQKSGFVPQAVIYRTDGDYFDNVPVTLDRRGGTALVSYPAPGDLTKSSMPIRLAEGYLLDRRGITANSAFTRYTYAEYSAMSKAPTPADLLGAVIPGAVVTKIVRLPMTVREAVSDTASVNRMIRSNSSELKIVYEFPKY